MCGLTGRRSRTLPLLTSTGRPLLGLTPGAHPERATYRQGVDEKLLLNVDSLCDDLCQPVGLQGVLQQPAAETGYLHAHSS